MNTPDCCYADIRITTSPGRSRSPRAAPRLCVASPPSAASSARCRATTASSVRRLGQGASSRLRRQAGSVATSPACGPRLHDFRHRFAVSALTSWQEAGADVGALLPLLSTVTGHVNPASTYWYLTSTPELMAPVAARLEAVFEGER